MGNLLCDTHSSSPVHTLTRVQKKKKKRRKFEDIYKLGQQLRSSKCATVYSCTRLDKPNALFAVKRVNKQVTKQIFKDLLPNLHREINFLKELRYCENVAKIYDTFETKKDLWIVMEYMTEGDLADLIMKGRMKEKEVISIVRQIAQALSYLHSRGIVHRDIKLENIMLTQKSGKSIVKLIDFGISTRIGDHILRPSSVGTPGWLAPEIISRRKYDESADMWSLGIATYVLLVGVLPFDEPLLNSSYGTKTDFCVDFRSAWHVTTDGCDFISRLITKDPSQRLTASEALKHPWLTRGFVDSTKHIRPRRSWPYDHINDVLYSSSLPSSVGGGSESKGCSSPYMNKSRKKM